MSQSGSFMPKRIWFTRNGVRPDMIEERVGAQYMKTYEWRQRKVKGVTGDFNLCYQRIRCSECEVEYNRRKKMLAAAKSHDAQDPRVAELQKELDGFDYNSTTIDPRVLK